jgi:MFS family permease
MRGRHARRPAINHRSLLAPAVWVRATLVPGSRVGRRLAFIALVDAIGSGLYYTGAALFFTRYVGLSAGQVGTGLTIAGLAGLVFALPVGMLADRVGCGRVLIGLQLCRAVCYAAYCGVTGFGPFVVVAAFIGITDAATPPNHQAVVAAAVPADERVDTLAKVRAVRNIGFGVGALATTVAIAQGTRGAYLALVAANAVSFLLAAALLYAIGVTRTDVSVRPVARAPLTFRIPIRYACAAVLNGVLSVHTTLLAIAMPLWIAGHTKVPATLLGPLITANTVLAVLAQARVARPASQLAGALRAAGRAGLALAGFAVLMYLVAQSPGPLLAAGLAVAAVLFLTAGELLQSAAGWTVSHELAPAERRSQYLSTFQLGISVQAIAAPWLITRAVFPTPGGWLVFAAVVAVAGIGMRLVRARRAARHRLVTGAHGQVRPTVPSRVRRADPGRRRRDDAGAARLLNPSAGTGSRWATRNARGSDTGKIGAAVGRSGGRDHLERIGETSDG